MLSQRPADLQRDRDFILELKCLGNYESDQAWFAGDSYEAYRVKWLSTSQPDGSLAFLAERLRDPRAFAEVWEEDGVDVGLLVIGFTAVEGYGLIAAEVDDIAVLPAYQRRGIGTRMLEHAEALARERGAHLLRSETGSRNLASRGLHESRGFDVFRLQYEKRLVPDARA